jgi:hypothetical protein
MKNIKTLSGKEEMCLRLCVQFFFSNSHYLIHMTFSIESYEEAIWGREWCWYMQFDPIFQANLFKEKQFS